MSDSYLQLQPFGPVTPAYFSAKNDLFKGVRRDFALGILTWVQAAGFKARLFNTLYEPNFAEELPMAAGLVPSAAWVSGEVDLQAVSVDDDGHCRAHGVRFGPISISGSYPIHGCCIYTPFQRMIWAATDYVGNFPVPNQDVYVVWPGNFGGPFRL